MKNMKEAVEKYYIQTIAMYILGKLNKEEFVEICDWYWQHIDERLKEENL